MPNKLNTINQLFEVQVNIEAVTVKINAAKKAPYYTIFNKYNEQQRQIEILEKCLAYWQRRFNRILLSLTY